MDATDGAAVESVDMEVGCLVVAQDGEGAQVPVLQVLPPVQEKPFVQDEFVEPVELLVAAEPFGQEEFAGHDELCDAEDPAEQDELEGFVVLQPVLCR